MEKKENASQWPKIYYGLHMAEGVAQYNEKGKTSRIFIGEEAIKRMNPSFAGKPVFVKHPEMSNEEMIAAIGRIEDGLVSESFFNKSDGKYWVKFIVSSDRGHEAIRKGWKLSNSYFIKSSKDGGTWHNVPYDREVVEGEYQHLAIVDDPRYEESVILTPEEFRVHNLKKEAELKVLENSKKEKRPMFKNLFKKQKIENSADLESAFVELEDGSEKSLAEIIEFVSTANKAEKEKLANAAKEKDEPKYNLSDKIKVGEEEMSIGELVKKYQSLNAKKKNADDEDDEDEIEDSKKKKNKKKANDADAGEKEEKKGVEESKKNSKESEEDDEAPRDKKHFEALKNAREESEKAGEVVDLAVDKLARGKARYGSGA